MSLSCNDFPDFPTQYFNVKSPAVLEPLENGKKSCNYRCVVSAYLRRNKKSRKLDSKTLKFSSPTMKLHKKNSRCFSISNSSENASWNASWDWKLSQPEKKREKIEKIGSNFLHLLISYELDNLFGFTFLLSSLRVFAMLQRHSETQQEFPF